MDKQKQKALQQAKHILQEHFDTSVIFVRDMNGTVESVASGDEVLVKYAVSEGDEYYNPERYSVEDVKREPWEMDDE